MNGAGPARTTLVAGAHAGAREAAIAAALGAAGDAAAGETAVILEGLPDGQDWLAGAAAGGLHVVRIAPGCLCCAGNIILRVTLNRVLRRRPARLFIGLADGAHVGQLRAFLAAPPYAQLLRLEADLPVAGARGGT